MFLAKTSMQRWIPYNHKHYIQQMLAYIVQLLGPFLERNVFSVSFEKEQEVFKLQTSKIINGAIRPEFFPKRAKNYITRVI